MSEQEQEKVNEQVKQIPKFTPDGNKDVRSNRFYLMLLSQLSLVLLSTFIITMPCYYKQKTLYPRQNKSFEEYCALTKRCRTNNYQYHYNYKNEDMNEYELWKTSFSTTEGAYTCLFYFGLVAYPLFTTLVSLFRGNRIIKKTQKFSFVLSYPLISFFAQAIITILKRYEFENTIIYIQMHIGFIISNVVLLIINQYFLKFKLDTKATTQKIINGYFSVLVLQGIVNGIALSTNGNWIPHLLIMLYSQIYMLHLNTNLFKNNNDYALYDMSLLRLIWEKVVTFFEVEDVYKDVGKDHFVIKKKYFYVGGLGILLSIFLKEFFFNIPVAIGSSIITIILAWDTSLVSLSQKLTLDDQYLAMNLIFLDLFMPIRNIITAMIV